MRTARAPALSLAPFALLVTACATAQRATPRAPRSEAAPAAEALPVRFYALARDFSGPHRVDARRVYWGGLRAEVDGAQVTRVADVALGGAVVAAVPTDRGWLFVDQRGDASRAAGYLDAPTPLGRIDPSYELACLGRSGRLACVADGALWSTDGTRSIERVPEHRRGAVLSAGFLDERFGAAVFEGGVLAYTRDGGDTWRPEPLPDGRAATRIALRGDALVAHTTRGVFALHPSRGLVRRDDDADRGSSEASDREALAPGLHAVVAERFPAHWDWLTFTRPYQWRDDGTFLALDVSARTLTRHERTRGVRAEPLERVVFDQHTDVASWSRGLAWRHRGALLRATTGLAFERVADDAGDDRACVLQPSDDGAHAAGLGPCDGERRLWVLEASRGRLRPAALATEDTPRFFVGMHGALVLGARCAGRWGAEPPCAPVVIDTERDARVPLTLDGAPLPATLEGTLAPDGTLTALLTPSNNATESRRRVAVGPLTGALRSVTLPPGALTARFLDARRGIAAGATWGSLYRTRDGGERWEPLRIPASIVDPEARLDAGAYVSHSWAGAFASAIDCDERRCNLFGRVAMVGWGPLPEDALHREPVRREPSPLERRSFSAECVFEVGSEGAPASDGPGPHAPGDPFVFRAPRAWASLERAAAGLLRLRWRLARAGAPRRGDVTFRLADVPSPDAERSAAARVAWELRAVTERGLLFERCVAQSACALLFSPLRGAPVVLRSAPDEEASTPRGEVVDALALADGGVLVRTQRELEAERVTRFGPDGRARWARDFVFDREHSRRAGLRGGLRGLALLGGAPSLVTEARAPDGLLVFSLDDPASEGVFVPSPVGAAVRACRGPAGSSALTVRLREHGRSPALSLTYTQRSADGSLGASGGSGSFGEHPVLAELEATADALCVRSLERADLGYAPATAPRFGGVLARAGSDGALTGSLYARDATLPLRCELR